MPDIQENVTVSPRSQVELWTAELAALRHDPTVRKFLELQERIKWTYAFAVRADSPSLSDAMGLEPALLRAVYGLGYEAPAPYDLYDAFVSARDLAGTQVSAHALSRLLFGRFPEMSNADWQVVMHFLIERGVAEVVRTTEEGRPDSYRFAPPRDEGNGRTSTQSPGRTPPGTARGQKGLGLPHSELSGLKADDLEDVVDRSSEGRA